MLIAMFMRHLILPLAITMAAPVPAIARNTFDTADMNGGSGELAPVLQCVPYARQVSGIQIYGDAHTWWGQAQGRYERGSRPRVGAVMAFEPHGNSVLGHVAAVSRIVDARTVLIRHANWSEPGLIEDDVRAVDVSPANDWSEVRIWYGPTEALGANHWPLYGFIYNERARRNSNGQLASSRRRNDPIGDIIARLN